MARAFPFRFLLMLLVWLVLTGAAPAAWLPGLLAAAAAAVLGLRLMPRRGPGLRWRRLPALAADFLQGSLVGGIDVARRALHPRLPLRPGWVRQPLRLPPGPARTAFGDLVSLMPGTLPAGDDGADLLVHCLDAGPAAASDLDRRAREFEQLAGQEERPGG